MTGPWCVFVVIELASIDSCQHYHLIRFRLSTRDSLVPSRPRQFRMWRHLPDSANWPRYEAKKWQNRTLWRKFNQKPLWVSGSTLCAYYKHTHLRYFTAHVVHMRESSFSFRFVFNHFWPSTLIRCVCFSVLINFQERFEIYALSMKTLRALVWTEGLRASKCHRFQKKTHVSVAFRLKSASFFSHAMPRSGNKDTNAETY